MVSAGAAKIDRKLTELEEAFDFLQPLAPSNEKEAWESFRAGGFKSDPSFEYPPIEDDLDGLRKELDGVVIEDVGDPGVEYLLRAKRDELDKQLALVQSRSTAAFLPNSMRLYDPVQLDLLREAEHLLCVFDGEEASSGEVVGAAEIRKQAEQELDHYRNQLKSFDASIVERPADQGFLAEGGDLVMPEGIELAPERLKALMQHEIGIHIVTFYNAGEQPMQLLRVGLASFDELQEALGAFSEYLVGGITGTRLRNLAGRVIAAWNVERNASFVDSFHVLTKDHGFSDEGAFEVLSRVHCCGGFTRDLIYLRGLMYLLDYLRCNGELEPLYIGKVGHAELPVVWELIERGVLKKPALVPRVFEMDGAQRRLERARKGMKIKELVG